MAEPNKCSSCGAELSPGTPRGHCLPCLLRLGFEASEPPSPATSSPAEKVGDRIDRFKLLQQIGEGGCGIVYMAGQEQPVRRQVALKVIKLGMDTRQVVARFEAERQALAMMDHPNIARVFEAGATDTGRPYFVMELVRGVKITEYCDVRKYSTRQRLELFIQVCEAVQHAHQKGIIHRDLKPSNVLVTEQDGVPLPKIIDFGVAKAMYDRLTDKTLFTAFDQFIGTPAYTSPEQAGLGGLDVDTRSDIYSLGVLLYELLTGKLPFENETIQRAAMHEVLRIIRETEPSRPSVRMTTLTAVELTTTAQRRQIEPSRLPRLFQGDLDLIVMKTLEKDRRRRYETAIGLAADLQRHLNNEPVEARPPSPAYRFEKMVRRNKVAFAAISSVMAALLLGMTMATWEFFQEKQARERAVIAERDEKNLRARAEQARNEAENARANEALLRKEVEARVKILQARSLYTEKKYDDAEKLLNNIEPTAYEADSTHSDLRREFIWKYVSQEKWPEAVSNIEVLLRVDGGDASVVIAQDHYLYVNALVQIEDLAAYNRYRLELFDANRTNSDPELAKFLCEITMLRPAAAQMLESVRRFYDIASTRLRYPETGKQDNEVSRRTSLALVDYRRGDYAAAAERCQTCLAQFVSDPSRIPSVLALSAMAHHGMHADDTARLELALAGQIVSPAFEQGTASYKANSMGHWIELVETRNLLREATNLVGQPPQEIVFAATNALAKVSQIEALVTNAQFRDANPAQFDDAVRQIGEIPSLAIELEGAATGKMFSALGNWRRLRSEWPETAALWRTVIYGPENRGSLFTGQDLSTFYLSYAPLLVVIGDTNAFEALRAHAVATFGSTGLAANAERVLTVCLLRPAESKLINALTKPAKVITSAKPPSAGWVPWGDSALALFEYRRGNPTRTLELAQKNLSAANLAPELRARFQVLTALAAAKVDQQDMVQKALAQCREDIETNFKASGQDRTDKWHDWWINHVLLQETVSFPPASNNAGGQEIQPAR